MRIAEYIRSIETGYGTTYDGSIPTAEECLPLIGLSGISSKLNDDLPNSLDGFKFGSEAERSYVDTNDVKFTTGLEYSLGAIQPLMSPDMFSVSEMKMYDYANRTNNKVFVAEWDPETETIEYNGAGTIKTSQGIQLSGENIACVAWKHSFGVPAKYLEADVYARFIVDIDSFKTRRCRDKSHDCIKRTTFLENRFKQRDDESHGWRRIHKPRHRFILRIQVWRAEFHCQEMVNSMDILQRHTLDILTMSSTMDQQ